MILIKEESVNQFENLMLILNIGVLLYGIMGVRGLWSRPLKIKIQELTKAPDKMITQQKYDKIESMKINLDIAKYKGIISLLMSFIFMITMSIKASTQYREDFAIGNFFHTIYFYRTICYLHNHKYHFKNNKRTMETHIYKTIIDVNMGNYSHYDINNT